MSTTPDFLPGTKFTMPTWLTQDPELFGMAQICRENWVMLQMAEQMQRNIDKLLREHTETLSITAEAPPHVKNIRAEMKSAVQFRQDLFNNSMRAIAFHLIGPVPVPHDQ